MLKTSRNYHLKWYLKLNFSVLLKQYLFFDILLLKVNICDGKLHTELDKVFAWGRYLFLLVSFTNSFECIGKLILANILNKGGALF